MGMELKSIFYIFFLYACLQVKLSTLKRYFIKDKKRSIKPGENNYSPNN